MNISQNSIKSKNRKIRWYQSLLRKLGNVEEKVLEKNWKLKPLLARLVTITPKMNKVSNSSKRFLCNNFKLWLRCRCPSKIYFNQDYKHFNNSSSYKV